MQPKPENEQHNITGRKKKHLEVCLDPALKVESGDTLFSHVQFINNPLPELDYDQIRTDSRFLDKRINAPVFISSMTGGSSEGFKANKDLARAAGKMGLPVGLGSMRVLFYHPELKDHFALRSYAGDSPVFGNLSAVQVREQTPRKILDLVSELELDAIAIHLNPGQELFQTDGDRDFRQLLKAIEGLAPKISVIVKETGFGIPPVLAGRLLEAGCRYIDVAGSGGTNWIRVEMLREEKMDGLFDEWGIPTALNLAALGAADHQGRILASGGLRSATDFAKAIALGAEAAGTALPLIRAWKSTGLDGIVHYLQQIITGIKNIMLLTGSGTIADLQRAPLLLSPAFIDMARQLAAGGQWRERIRNY